MADHVVRVARPASISDAGSASPPSGPKGRRRVQKQLESREVWSHQLLRRRERRGGPGPGAPRARAPCRLLARSSGKLLPHSLLISQLEASTVSEPAMGRRTRWRWRRVDTAPRHSSPHPSVLGPQRDRHVSCDHDAKPLPAVDAQRYLVRLHALDGMTTGLRHLASHLIGLLGARLSGLLAAPKGDRRRLPRPGGTDYLRLTLSLSASADDRFQGQTSRIRYSFKGVPRPGGSKPRSAAIPSPPRSP
jgi:hypothetical protein